ncbi:hypothetical protein SGRIM119S_01824 [Streptomyces griseorubiginosus]
MTPGGLANPRPAASSVLAPTASMVPVPALGRTAARWIGFASHPARPGIPAAIVGGRCQTRQCRQRDPVRGGQ